MNVFHRFMVLYHYFENIMLCNGLVGFEIYLLTNKKIIKNEKFKINRTSRKSNRSI